MYTYLTIQTILIIPGMLSQSNHSAACTCINATVLRASTTIAARGDSGRLTYHFVRILARGLREMRAVLHVQQLLCVMACRPNLFHGSRRGGETEARAESFLRSSSLDALTGSWSANSRLVLQTDYASISRCDNQVLDEHASLLHASFMWWCGTTAVSEPG